VFPLILEGTKNNSFSSSLILNSCPEITDNGIEKLGSDLSTLSHLKDVFLLFQE